MEVGLVHKIDIDNEMQQAYLDYAMSVIVARALPDARDGLKPVHRRILYAMHDMGLRPDSAYKKSARIVGEVLGKYHPHGDMAVYEAMARLAQNFSMRYCLVDGQGNFGSVDGDAPAAMRYTEARLAAPAMNMLADIQKNTVDFDNNFDGSLKEPKVLPATIPNLLINGATGIAVGMATSIPPHNLSEVIDALHFCLENWEKLDDISVDDLMQYVQGPDFPTGGIILQDETSDNLVSAYSTGRGRVTVQASAHLEEMERGRNRIIVTELPYMTNKSALIERIAALVREERLEGIADLRDESDRHGMRIVIELNKAAEPVNVLSELYKSTPMQTTFSLIMLALVDGEPRLLGLKQMLRIFIEHRLEIIRRRSLFDLDRARQRAHILEGLRIALANLDEVIALIRKAPDADTARDRLTKRFKLTLVQAQAILDMPLRRLAALERKKIEEEYKEVTGLIKELESLLKSPKKLRQVVDQELHEIKGSFGDRRRTHIARLSAEQTKTTPLTVTELKPDKLTWLSITTEGLISRTLDEKQPRTSGRETPIWLVQANTRDTLYLVAENGEASAVPVHAIPETEQHQNGSPLAKVSALKDGQTLAGIFTLSTNDRKKSPSSKDVASEGQTNQEGYLVTVTRQGMVKKSLLSELPGPSAGLFTLVKVNEGDCLIGLRISHTPEELILVTASGIAIRFPGKEIRPMGLVAAGVMGIKLKGKDEVIGMDILPKPGDIFLLASDGTAKRVPVDQFPKQGRYGQGVITWKLPSKARVIAMAVGLGTQRATIYLSKLAPKSIRFDEAPLATRAARGQSIQEIKLGDFVTRLVIPIEMEIAQNKEEFSQKGNRKRRPTGANKAEKMSGSEPESKPPDIDQARSNRSKSAGQKTPKPQTSPNSTGKTTPTKTQKTTRQSIKAPVKEEIPISTDRARRKTKTKGPI